MALGLIGRKCGMTRVFQDDGQSVPVTVIEVLPNRVTCIKTADTDGYVAVQVTASGTETALVRRRQVPTAKQVSMLGAVCGSSV